MHRNSCICSYTTYIRLYDLLICSPYSSYLAGDVFENKPSSPRSCTLRINVVCKHVPGKDDGTQTDNTSSQGEQSNTDNHGNTSNTDNASNASNDSNSKQTAMNNTSNLASTGVAITSLLTLVILCAVGATILLRRRENNMSTTY